MKKSLACHAKQTRQFAAGGVPGLDYADDSMGSLTKRLDAMKQSNYGPTPVAAGIQQTQQPAQSPILQAATQQPGLPDPNGSDYDAINAEKTARWGAQGLADKAKYATSRSDYNGAMNLLTGAVKDYTKQYSQPLQFADGGKVETADELMARMTAKYGAPAAGPAPAQQPASPPAPQPKPQQPQPQGSGLGQGIMGLIRGRQQQIDKASGYANGGKIKGPGTPTSDSIDAEVEETGEPIKVATEERILSKAQDQFLERVAKQIGFKSLEELLESGTGKPVGPTVKGGKIAAAAGMGPTVETPYGPYTSDSGGLVKDFKDWQSRKIADTNAKIDAAMGKTPPAQPVQATAQPSAAPAVSPAKPQGLVEAAMQPVNSTPDGVKPITTKDIVPNGYSDRGAGIVAQRGQNGRLNVTNVGTEGLADPSRKIVDGSESALIDQKNSTYNPAALKALASSMEADRLRRDATDPTITDPAVQENARKGLGLIQAAQLADQHQQASQVDMQGKRLANQQAQIMADLQGRAIAGDAKALKTLNDLHGKNQDEYVALHAAGGSDPSDPTGLKRLPDQVVVVNKRTGQRVDQAAPASKINVAPGMAVNAPDGTHTFQGKTVVVKGGKVTEVK